MARDWGSEWEILSKREREAFRLRNVVFGELMAIFTRCGAPDMELADRKDAADKAWKRAKSDIDAFIAEYRRAA